MFYMNMGKYEGIHQVANFGFKEEEQSIRVLKYEDKRENI